MKQDLVNAKSDYAKQLEGNFLMAIVLVEQLLMALRLDLAETRQQLASTKSDYAKEFDGTYICRRFKYFATVVDFLLILQNFIRYGGNQKEFAEHQD